jgi:hypothetical protein
VKRRHHRRERRRQQVETAGVVDVVRLVEGPRLGLSGPQPPQDRRDRDVLVVVDEGQERRHEERQREQADRGPVRRREPGRLQPEEIEPPAGAVQCARPAAVLLDLRGLRDAPSTPVHLRNRTVFVGRASRPTGALRIAAAGAKPR